MQNLVDALCIPEAEQLAVRLEQAPADAYIRGMFLQNAIETVGRTAGPEARGEMQAATQGLNLRLMSKVPLKTFNELRMQALPHLRPHVDSDAEAMVALGQGAVDIFFESVAGRTMKLLSGSDPHRLMGAAPSAYELVLGDQGSRQYRRMDETSGEFQFAADWIGPSHHFGVFRAAIQQTCGVDAEITVTQSDVSNFVLHVSWD